MKLPGIRNTNFREWIPSFGTRIQDFTNYLKEKTIMVWKITNLMLANPTSKIARTAKLKIAITPISLAAVLSQIRNKQYDLKVESTE